MTRATRRGCQALTILVFFLSLAASADESAPDVALNAVTGKIEVADTVTVEGDRDIRYTTKPMGGGAAQSVLLTSSAFPDLDPKIEIRGDGETWVVWWRGSYPSQVFLKIQDVTSGFWSAEKPLSRPYDAASHPTIADDGTTIWVGFQVGKSSGSDLVVLGTEDGSDPFPTATIVGSTAFGTPDLQAQAVSGRVWMSWVDSTTVVKWSQYDPDTESWSAPAAQSYAGTTPQAARDAILDTLLGF